MIVVQAIHADGETDWLLEAAARTPSIAGVVGWTDLTAPPDAIHERLAALRRAGLVGVRHLVQFDPDLLLTPGQLDLVPELSERVPDLRTVIDHLAKPPIASGLLDPWRDAIRRAARNPNVFSKVSGMVTEADHRRWAPGDLRPYIEVVLDAFGPGRLMFGSDWPVCTLAAPYERVVDALDENLRVLLGDDDDARDRIYRTTAAGFYGVSREPWTL